MNDIQRFIRSLRHAMRGVLLVLRFERNFRIQVTIGLAVLGAFLLVPLKAWEQVVLLVVVALVLVLELLNSSVERLLDLLKPRLDVYAGDVKDMMAGAVLIASLCAILVGLIIFWPHLASMLAHV